MAPLKIAFFGNFCVIEFAHEHLHLVGLPARTRAERLQLARLKINP
jgi:hypothetical protein